MTQTTIGGMPVLMPREVQLSLEERKKTKVMCPWCLYLGGLDEFTVYLKRGKKGKIRISSYKARCPDCYGGFYIKTLLKIAKMNFEEYCYWYWDRIFCWNAYEKVEHSLEKRKKRMYCFSKENRNKFWEVYHKYKNDMDKMSRTLIYDDYSAHGEYKTQEEKDFEEYKRQHKKDLTEHGEIL